MTDTRSRSITRPVRARVVTSRRVRLFPSELLAAPVGSGPVRCAHDDDLVTISIAMAAPTAPCPRCGNDARRVHSRYTRRLADLPCFGIPVPLELTVRRFRCSNAECLRRIWPSLPGFAAKHARTTNRLRRSHEAIGHALGGEAGSRLAVLIAMPTSPDTLLRRVKQLEDVTGPPPRVVGIDDWAWSRGTATARSSWTWRGETSSTSCPTATRTPWRRGSKPPRRRSGQPGPFLNVCPGGHEGCARCRTSRRPLAPPEEPPRGR